MIRRTATSAYLSAALAMAVSQADAGLITVGDGPGITGATNFVDFEGATTPDVGTDFSDGGLSVSTLMGSGAALFNNSECSNFGAGVTGNYLYIGAVADGRGRCVDADTTDGIALIFDAAVEELSWSGFGRTASVVTVEALLDGAVVSATVFENSTSFMDKTVTFSGATFNEIRLQEANAVASFVGIDDIAWRVVAVPAPGTLPLIAVGVLGASAVRRRRQRSAGR